MSETQERVESQIQRTKFCPRCGQENNVRSIFCKDCGYRFDREPPSNNVAKDATQPLDSATRSTVSRTRSQELRLLTIMHLSPIASVLQRFQPSNSLRELYVQAAAGSVQQQAYSNAIETLQLALKAEDTNVQTSDVLFYLAYVYELMRDASHAFAIYLQAILAAPASIDDILLYAHSLLTADIALEQSRWVLDEWEQQIEDKCASPSNRMHVKLLIAHIYMFLGRYKKARTALQEAARQAPELAVTMTPYLFGANALPPALADAETNASTALTLAQLYQAIGHVPLGQQEIDHALALGLTGAGDTALAQAYQCKAELLAQSGNQHDAAQYFFDAGIQYLTNKPSEALNPLRRANELDAQHIQVYWNLAEALRLSSYDADNRFARTASLIRESLAVWERGYHEVSHPDPDDVWAYFSRALMSYQLIRLDDVHPWAVMWQALALLEQAAICNRTAYTDAYLGSFCRVLGLPDNALVLTQKAIDAAPDDPFVLGERAAALYNTGRYDEARQAIDLLPDSPDKPFWQAYILLKKGDFAASVSLLDQVLAEHAVGVTDATRLLAHVFRSYCYRRMGKIQPSLDDVALVRAKYDAADLDNWSNFAWAAFFRGLSGIEGEIAFALKLCQQHPDIPGEDPGNALFLKGLCLLVQGKLEEAETTLAQSVTMLTTERQLDDLLANFPELESFAPDFVQQPDMHAILERIQQQAEERKASLEPPPTLEDELKVALKAYEGDDDKSDGWAWIAALAGLGRLYSETQRWQEAFETYHQLAEKAAERFPEARKQQEKTLDHLFDQLDEAIKSGQIDDNLQEHMQYIHSLLVPPEIDDAADLPVSNRLWLGRLFCQRGYAQLIHDGEAASYLAGTEEARRELHAAMTKGEDAAGYFVRSLVLFAQSDQENLDADFARACQPMLHNVSSYWLLDKLLGEMAHDEDAIQGLPSVLQQVRTALIAYLEEAFQLSAQSPANMLPTPSSTGLFLELQPDLLPDNLDQGNAFHDWILIKDYIPELRQRLQTELGIILPGVQVQDNTWIEARAYRIRNFDDVLATGKTQSSIHHGEDSPEMRYTPASLETLKQLGIEEDDLVAAAHPLSGAPGYWTPARYWEIISSHDTELWADPFVYITFALEATVRANMALLLDMQTAQSLLDSWRKDETLKTRLDSLLTDATARFHFARLLRSLAQEQVSLAAPAAILDALADLDLAKGDLTELIHLTRLRLKPYLPGNKPGVQRIELPAAWEDKLLACMQRQDGLTAFVVPPETTDELIQSLQEWIQPNMTGWRRALVTRSAALRPFLWQLLHTSFPLLCVLSQEEILDMDKFSDK